jgi:hypothetical protein
VPFAHSMPLAGESLTARDGALMMTRTSQAIPSPEMEPQGGMQVPRGRER